jgi:hypothetical protein
MQKTSLLLLLFIVANHLIAQDPFQKKGFELDIDLMAPLGDYKGFGGLARFDFWQVDRNWGSTKSALRFIVAQQSLKKSGTFTPTIIDPSLPYYFNIKRVILDLAVGMEQQFYFNRSRLYYGADFYFYRANTFGGAVPDIFLTSGIVTSASILNLSAQTTDTGIAPFVGYNFFIRKWFCAGTELSIPVSYSYINLFNRGNSSQFSEFDFTPRLSRLLYIGFHF